MKGAPADVYIVHCVDTEGPLAEIALKLGVPLASRATLPAASADMFARDLKATIAKHRAHTLGSWESISAMLARVTSDEFRTSMRDDYGRSWVFNWFCMDHVDYLENPRGRAMGVHVVFDAYCSLVERQRRGDALHWHFHPMSTYREANKCATSYINSPQLWDLLCRRVIERRFFPVAHRAGFQDERPDSHWFLEQFVPFDFSNLASDDFDLEANPDMVDGRFNDWRWAPRDWSTYQPHHDSYQLPGKCRRKIARCLTVLNRCANLDEKEVLSAFARAASGQPTLMAFSSHDWRDLATEVDYVRFLLRRAKQTYPHVKFSYSEAVAAFNAAHPAEEAEPLRLRCQLITNKRGLPARVNIEVAQGRLFGPQPFLAVRTRSRRFIHDNLNLWHSMGSFNYVFDDHSIAPEDVAACGIAANDFHGRQSIHVVQIDEIARQPGDTTEF